MKIDKKDLALEHLVGDEGTKTLVACRWDGLSWATDGYVYGEYRSHRRRPDATEPLDHDAINTAGYLHLDKDQIRKLKKEVPSGVRAVRDGLDCVEVEPTGQEAMVPMLDPDSPVTKAIEGAPTPDLIFTFDPDLLAKAIRFLFAGHTGSMGRKQLSVDVRYARVGGVQYPIYVLRNRTDPTRRVVLAGQKENT